MKYYKILNGDGYSCHGGSYKWDVPKQNADGSWTPGRWATTIEGELLPCANGYHLCCPSDILLWIGHNIYEAEYRGEICESDNKVVVRDCRLVRKVETWNSQIARLFMVWCIRQALKVTPLPHIAEMLDVIESYANGLASQEEFLRAKNQAYTAILDFSIVSGRPYHLWNAVICAFSHIPKITVKMVVYKVSLVPKGEEGIDGPINPDVFDAMVEKFLETIGEEPDEIL